ncbi:stage II sporulation protein E [Clostridium thermobutyricum]|uniref:stage II sporulation protein E n=1 Tax=Clostridium thermobutyricum TaxID=29372 RepID=UPI003F52552A
MQYKISKGLLKERGKFNSRELSVEKIEPLKLFGTFLAVFLLSRVVIYINKEDIVGMAPFGLAFLISMLRTKNESKVLFCSLGAILGYITIGQELGNSAIYIITTLITLMIFYVLNKRNKYIGIKSVLSIYFLVQIINSVLINKYDLSASLFVSIIYTGIVIPIYFVIRYGLDCFENYNTNYYFNIEELISIGLVFCLMIGGIGDLSIFNIHLREIFSILFIISIAYVGGAANGSAIGIAMGLILGISNGAIVECVGFYSVLGLVAGLFKETGKIFSLLSAITIYIILSLYSKGSIDNGIVEILIGGAGFLLIPNRILNCIETEMSTESKNEDLIELHMNQIKTEFSERIEGLGEVLNNVSESVANLSTNEVLLYKDKSTALVNNLADRICSDCKMCNNCWNTQFNQTYSCFEKIIRGKEENYSVFPAELEKKCMRKYELLGEVDKLVLSMNAEAINREKLEEGRKIIAEHMKTMADNVGRILYDFKKDISMCTDLEKTIRRELNKNSVQYKDVFCFTDKDGKMKVKVNMSNCSGCRYCSKSVLPVVNSLVKRPMMIGKDGCSINPNNKDCTVTVREMPKYTVSSYVGMRIKEGEDYTGDTYNFGNVANGKYLTILSDGMGSGPEASKESKMTVDLVEKFINCGFGIDTALNTVNSIMTMKFDEDEKFSTLDMNTIDLYSGKISFIKVGATTSFIKRGKEIIKISSNMPPFGLVDKIEVDSIDKRIKNGDVIITLSDGVLDVDKSKIGDSEWLENYLIKAGSNPKDLAIDIIEESKKLNNGSIKDDMTVIVSKVQALY